MIKIEDCVPPLKYENTRVGKAQLREYKPGYFGLWHDNEFWMGYNTYNRWQCVEFLMEYNLAHGRVITTGMGFGIIQTILLNNSKVTELVVYERSQDVIDLFKLIAEKNNFDISAMKFVCKDADEMSGEDADCIFFDHWERYEPEKLYERVRIIANNNNGKLAWFWPAAILYSWFCKKNHYPVDLDTYQKWVKHINIKNFPEYLSKEHFENLLLLEKYYAENSASHIMNYYKDLDESKIMREKLLKRFANSHI